MTDDHSPTYDPQVERAARLRAAAQWLEHGAEGDCDPEDAIRQARHLIDAAECA